MTTVAIVFGVLLGVGGLFFVGIQVYAYSNIWLSSRRLRVELLRLNRVLSREEAKQRIARNEGMILVDAPTGGWNVVRIWWSPTTDFVAGPVWPDRVELASNADYVNHSRFIDVSTGSASLVDGFVMSRSPTSYLRKHFGLEACPFVFTGAILLEQHIKSRNLKSA